MKHFNVYCGKVLVETIPAEDQEIAIASAKFDVNSSELVGVEPQDAKKVISAVRSQTKRGAHWVAMLA